jgi:hypothetical protein
MSNNEWRHAAIKIGERLSSTGPEGYYNFTADQWLKWAEDTLSGIEKLVLQQARSPEIIEK